MIRYNPVAALYENGHIWLLKGGLLFKFDEKNLRFDFDKLPKRIDEQFPGVPRGVRTAFTHNGKHYFFIEPAVPSSHNLYNYYHIYSCKAENGIELC